MPKRKKGRHGSGHVDIHGYRLLRINGRRVREHRYVMELHLGRHLLAGEVVHHVDGNKLNNSISNLELLKSQSEHTIKHVVRFADDTHKECSKCGTVKPRQAFNKRSATGHNKDPNSAYCRECQAKSFQERKAKAAPCLICGRTAPPAAYGGKCATCISRERKEIDPVDFRV